MGLKRVSWVRRYQGQCRALRPLGHQGYRLRNHKKDPPLCSGYTPPPPHSVDNGLHGEQVKKIVQVEVVESMLPLGEMKKTVDEMKKLLVYMLTKLML